VAEREKDSEKKFSGGGDRGRGAAERKVPLLVEARKHEATTRSAAAVTMKDRTGSSVGEDIKCEAEIVGEISRRMRGLGRLSCIQRGCCLSEWEGDHGLPNAARGQRGRRSSRGGSLGTCTKEGTIKLKKRRGLGKPRQKIGSPQI